MNSHQIDTPRKSILIVDDKPANLRLLSQILARQGYRVRAANGGARALASAWADPPDLILLDIKMPEMNGYEVCERLKADERTHDVPIIFISALDETDEKVQAFAMGGVDYIIKPFQVEEVLARLETHLALRYLQKDLQEKNTQLEQEIIERKRAEETLHHYTERLKILREIDQSILVARSPETIAMAAIGRIRQLIPCQRAMVMAVEETGQIKMLAAESSGEIGPVADRDVYQEMLGERALSNGRVQGVEDLAALHQRSPMQQSLYTAGVCSYIIAPLFIQGELVGTLNLEADHPRVFTSDHIAIATEVAVLLAVAMRQTRLYEQAQQEITERMRVEESLRQQALELEVRNAELDAFAHTVAHDLKNPLFSIIGFSGILRSKPVGMSDEQQRDFLHKIEQNGLRMSNIIDELLLLASVREMEEIETRPLDMGPIVAQARERLGYLIEERQAEFISPDDWPVALGYGPWVEEVWVNYLSNALKYGGRPPCVELGTDVGQIANLSYNMVRFWVRDNGPGLSAEEQARLFTPFERLHQARTEGHGLGLSIVRRIVEKLGGQVGVESKVGQGSIFSFTLPAVDSQAKGEPT